LYKYRKQYFAIGSSFFAIFLLGFLFFYKCQAPFVEQNSSRYKNIAGYNQQGCGIFLFNGIRVQLLSDTLLRIEQAVAGAYEDQKTFTVTNREWPGTKYRRTVFQDRTEIATPNYTIIARNIQQSSPDLKVMTAEGSLVYDYARTKGAVSYLPGPGDTAKAWVMRDSPRLVPPVWGATPGPSSTEGENTAASGWKLDGPVHDDYIFILQNNTYQRFQKNFLKLTGPTPLPPLYAFGLWTSRYHAYSEKTALQVVDTYRKKQIPLDVFVLDTDWREGGGVGYKVNKALFPDMRRFTQRMHEKDVFLVMNDHPEAVGETAVDPKGMEFRYEQLTRLLGMGIDAWWYDRNWHAHLKSPLPGINKEVWGMRLYHDTVQRFRPKQRPLILANVDGIDHSQWNVPSHPAAHRFPIWWTGDTKSEWKYLQSAVVNAVDSGIGRFMPYVSEDIGGHYGRPTEEFYLRSIQYGVFSPILRLHSSGATRYPWDFGLGTETIAARYIRLRYRLLPLIYSAARENYESGMPLLRRCDLYWPDYPAAKDSQQYLFGGDLLVAPVNDGKGYHRIPDNLLHTEHGQQGLQGEYFDNMELKGEPQHTRIDPNIDFNWGEGIGSEPAESVPADFFSVRWKGKLGPVVQSGMYDFGLIADDGVRLWIDDQMVVDFWQDQGATLRTGKVYLEKDHIYSVRIEYYDRQYRASCKLVWWNFDDQKPQTRTLWIPPGDWQDLWTGEIFTGPKSVTVISPLWHIPLFVRSGGIILSIPQKQHTDHHPWPVVVADAFVASEARSTQSTLYEDDGRTTAYRRDTYRRTTLTMDSVNRQVMLRIDKSEGALSDNLKTRTWIIRLHFPKGYKPTTASINGKIIPLQHSEEAPAEVSARLLEPKKREKKMIFLGKGDPPSLHAGPILEIILRDRNIHQEFVLKVPFLEKRH